MKKTPRRKPTPRQPSKLERNFSLIWLSIKGPFLTHEHVFYPGRKWRADFAHLPSRTLIEVEGGAYGGRHTRPQGFKADLDKYFAAAMAGWRVIRIGAHQINVQTLEQIRDLIKDNKTY